MTRLEASTKGGIANAQKNGHEHFVKIGALGGRPRRKPFTPINIKKLEVTLSSANTLTELRGMVQSLYPQCFGIRR